MSDGVDKKWGHNFETLSLQAKVAQIQFFSNQAQATFICGPKSDTYPMFCNTTSVLKSLYGYSVFISP